MSTLPELTTFVRALGQGKLFKRQATMDYLLDFAPEANRRFALGARASDYGMGLRRLRYDDYQFIGHSGSWGCLMYYDVEKDLAIALTINQGGPGERVRTAFQAILETIKTNQEHDKN